jgi:hypothetical protein
MVTNIKAGNVVEELKRSVSRHVAAKCKQDGNRATETLQIIVERSAVFLESGGTVDELFEILENKNRKGVNQIGY